MICGVDEAGRGPVIGPLVIAGFKCQKGEVEDLESMGVRDSKRLSSKRREEIFGTLVEGFETRTVIVPPRELDSFLFRGVSLNRLEGERFGSILNRLRPATAYIDCADVKPDNFRSHIESVLEHECKLVIAHKADDLYPPVSAASIIAKVTRDREIEKLKEIYGDLGSGYTSDKKTVQFIEEWYQEKKDLPDFVRKSWRLKIFNNRRLDSQRMEDFF
jgi:ribonuclease HII